MSDQSGRKIHAAILLVSAAFFSVLLWRSYHGVRPPSDAPAPVAVEVRGDVPAPGIYLLDRERAAVSDALSAAGWAGIVPDGPSRLESGESLIVTKTDEGPHVVFDQMRASVRLTLGLKIDINSASEEDLMLVPQMRPEFAAAIVNGRLERPWEKVVDLAEIHGIGSKTAQKFVDYLEAAPKGRQ